MSFLYNPISDNTNFYHILPSIMLLLPTSTNFYRLSLIFIAFFQPICIAFYQFPQTLLPFLPTFPNFNQLYKVLSTLTKFYTTFINFYFLLPPSADFLTFHQFLPTFILVLLTFYQCSLTFYNFSPTFTNPTFFYDTFFFFFLIICGWDLSFFIMHKINITTFFKVTSSVNLFSVSITIFLSSNFSMPIISVLLKDFI